MGKWNHIDNIEKQQIVLYGTEMSDVHNAHDTDMARTDERMADVTGSMGMSFMRGFREFMMKVLVEMRIRKKQKIRCGTGAEEGDSSAPFFSLIIAFAVSRTQKL